MAIKLYNGTNWNDMIGSASIGGTNVSVTAAGITSLGNTAPNTTNQALGVILAVVAKPTSSNFIIELLESGVVKATETINNADIVGGYQYYKFTTPYTFATTGAGAYTVRVKSSSGTQGTLRTITAGNLWNQIVYNSATTLGATDDAWIGGEITNAGKTTKTLTITGTSNSWGSGADTAMVSTTQWSMGAATTIFDGGSLLFDTTASTTLTQLGSVIVYRGGLFDMRPGSAYVNTLTFNQQATDGRFGIMHPANALSGQVLTTGKTVTVYAQYASGLGTAASPVVTQANHGLAVGDELIFGGATDYLKDERRFVISIPAANQLVLSSTLGGSENALTQTHAVGSYIGNLTRNSIINNTTTTAGFWIMNYDTNASPVSSYNYTRLEYSNCLSGKGVAINGGSTAVLNGNDATHDGLVVYHNSAAARNSVTLSGVAAQTITGVIMYNTRGTNYAAQSGYVLTGSNKTINYLLHFADPSSTTNAAGLSLNNAVANTINHYHSYGANANNGSLGYSLGMFNSFGNTFNDSSIDASRVQGLYYSGSLDNTFNGMDMAQAGTNTIDIFLVSSTKNSALFQDGNFASATLVGNYTNTLEGTEIAFQKLNGDDLNHRWYTPYGKGRSEQSTVRTGDLSLAIDPESTTTGFTWETLLPANSNLQLFLPGYFRRSAGLTGTVTVDLYLPYSTSPDETITLDTTTGSWLDFIIKQDYASAYNLFAKVRFNVKGTAGNTLYLDDFFNSGNTTTVNNNVASFETWHNGKPAPIFSLSDVSAIPAQTVQQTWSDSNTYNAGEKGTLLQDAADDADTAANK